jgi:hypothetical protein
LEIPSRVTRPCCPVCSWRRSAARPCRGSSGRSDR